MDIARRKKLRREMKQGPKKIRPVLKRTFRGLAGRRLKLESFGPKAPVFIAIVAGREPPSGTWISPTELRRFIEAAKKILQ